MSEQILGFAAFGALLTIAMMGYGVSASSAVRLTGTGKDDLQGPDMHPRT